MLSGGTGDLADVSGVTHVLGIPGVGGADEGIVHFGPDKWLARAAAVHLDK